MRRALIVFLGVMFAVALSVPAQAIPSLGVIDSALLSAYDGTGHSFPITSETTSLTLWWGSDSGDAPPADIWIATTAGKGYYFGDFELDTPLYDKVDGYPWADDGVQAYMRSLPDFPGTASDGWVAAADVLDPGHIMLTGGKDFWLWTGAFTGAGFPEGAWVFAMADIPSNETLDSNEVFQRGADKFSPKTTSSVPEPGTLLLLGSGLAGLALFGRRKSRRS
jgi:hypothetical protein